jgi:transposase-like protein
MNSDQREIQRKLQVLEHADRHGDVSKACRYFGIGRASFYRWRKAYSENGKSGLANGRSVPHKHPSKMSPEVEEKILHLRRTYHPGPIAIVSYLER